MTYSKLDKRDTQRRDEAITNLRAKAESYNNIVAKINELINGDLATARAEYEEAFNSASELRDDVVSQIDDHIEEKSEAWQEGDRGSAFSSWKDEWEEWQPELIDPVEELKEIEDDIPTQLEDLATEPSL